MTRSRAPGRLRVGLLNNMPDAALAATERQFLEALGGEDACDLQTFHLAQIRRSPAAEALLASRSGDLDALLGAGLDAVVVTGAEPSAARLSEERFYPQLTRLAGHALRTGLPVLWSCLSAHAVSYWLEGVERRRLDAKLSGVFTIEPRGALAPAGRQGRLTSPHSRWNTLEPERLEGAGFSILAHGEGCGVDAFSHGGAPGFLFLQGHPEYGAESLLAEYRRDLARANAAGGAPVPVPPQDYLPAALDAQLRGRGPQERPDPAHALELLTRARPRPERSWAAWSGRLFTAWLSEIRAHGAGRPGASAAPAATRCVQAPSNTAAIPCPPPMHIVSSP